MLLDLNDGELVYEADMVEQLLQVEEFKGAWLAYGNLAPERLTELKRVATIESIGSSTRIEGVTLSDADVRRVMQNIGVQSFASRDEQEVAGYADLLALIHESWQDMPLTENIVKQMHGVLMRHSNKDERHRGAYKTVENHVAAFDPDGREIGVVFQTAAAYETPRMMTELIDGTNDDLEKKKRPALITIGKFVVAFLAIHPFEDGNGRLSRALTQLLLLRAGYTYAPYCSMESIIEKNKQRYYLALRRTQKTIFKEKLGTATDWTPWLRFFLATLVRQVEHLRVKLAQEHLLERLPGLSVRIFEELKSEPMSLAALSEHLRVSRSTVRDQMAKLVQNGKVRQVGQGRSTVYALAPGRAALDSLL